MQSPEITIIIALLVIVVMFAVGLLMLSRRVGHLEEEGYSREGATEPHMHEIKDIVGLNEALGFEDTVDEKDPPVIWLPKEKLEDGGVSETREETFEERLEKSAEKGVKDIEKRILILAESGRTSQVEELLDEREALLGFTSQRTAE